MIAKEYNQEKGIDLDETYVPLVRLKVIRMLLAYDWYREFKHYQMDAKSTFLNNFIMEEVYVDQPSGFRNHFYPKYVFKLKKALYGPKQAPRTWYERLSNFLLEKYFSKGNLICQK